MNKVFEALERLAMPDELHIKECERLGIGLTDDYELIKQALLELKAIKEAKPSEVLECLKAIKLGIRNGIFYTLNNRERFINNENFNTIEQALLKSQEQEKENAEYKEVLRIIFEKNVDILELRICIEHNNDKIALKLYNSKIRKDWQLTEEEFDLLKRWSEKND